MIKDGYTSPIIKVDGKQVPKPNLGLNGMRRIFFLQI